MHTPGEWTNREHGTFVHSKHGNVCACGDPRASTTVGYTECDVGTPGLSEAVANARRIVHTANCHDDLLTALKDLTRFCDAVRVQVGMGKTQTARLEQARAAIAKATGAVFPPQERGS